LTGGLLNPHPGSVATSWFAGPLVSSAIVEKRWAIFRKGETLPRKDILSKFGITDRPDLRVHIIGKPDGPSMVDVHGPGDSLTAIMHDVARFSGLLIERAPAVRSA
jgi:hypothetical protein